MQTLQNHFLLAMPSLTDPYFERSLVYLCEHNEEGAMGLVVNIPVEMSLETMLTQLQLNPPNNPELKQPVLQGGRFTPIAASCCTASAPVSTPPCRWGMR